MLLRFAVTRDNADRMRVLETAGDIDHQDSNPGDTSFSFFVRTSAKICDAIVAHRDSNRRAMLIRYFNCIDDRRLRAALEAATECHFVESETPKPSNGTTFPKPAKRKRDDLWKGLHPR
jgi:hypothetical protein